MPMLFISMVIGFIIFILVFRSQKSKSKTTRFSTAWGFIWGTFAFCVLFLISITLFMVTPREDVMIEKHEIIPFEIQGQKYFTFSGRYVSARAIIQGEEEIKISTPTDVIEEERSDGVLEIYKDQSKLHYFLYFPSKTEKVRIPRNSQFKVK